MRPVRENNCRFCALQEAEAERAELDLLGNLGSPEIAVLSVSRDHKAKLGLRVPKDRLDKWVIREPKVRLVL